MNFDSVVFLSCFLPALMLLSLLPRGAKGRNVLLLAAGLLFYAFGSLTGLLLLLACAAVNYAFGVRILRSSGGGNALAAAAIALDLAFLGAFKYLNFALSALLPLFGASPVRLALTAPVGISFFTFKCISYIVDVRRDRRNGTTRFFDLLLYISFFPQIMAGPIARFPDFREQLDLWDRSPRQTAEGLRRFVVGLGKKLILAQTAAEVADLAFGADAALSAPLAWACAAAYMLQIYFDFSGYSDMALGLGRIFGFTAPENFDDPYAARSITDFWRRWHISLSLWFRDYLYIPLGGSRKGRARAAFNKFIVFVLCGLWHGAGWNFILWGAWHGVLSAAETLLRGKRRADSFPLRLLGRVYTLLAVGVGFVFFRASDPAEGWRILRAMLGLSPAAPGAVAALRGALTPLNAAILLAAVVLCFPLKKRIAPLAAKPAGRILSYALCAVLLVLCLTRLAYGGFAPFIYFQF